jgi:secreted trypsin-like serine protease
MKSALIFLGLAAFAAAGVPNMRSKVTFDAIARAGIRKNGAHPMSENRIVGGEDAELGQFPWQASMQWDFFGHICGASILSETVMITAAHCVEAVGEDESSITMLTGVTNLNGRGQEVGVKRIYKNPDYDSFMLTSDLAVLELAEALDFSDPNVGPITLGVGRTPVADKNGCVISGWGATDENGFVYPDDLQFLNLNFLDDAACADAWNNGGVDITNDVHICASTEEGSNACFGDSGGPLVCKTEEDGEMYLFGATSFGYSTCAQPEWPVVWTELPNFIDWIEESVGPLPKPE